MSLLLLGEFWAHRREVGRLLVLVKEVALRIQWFFFRRLQPLVYSKRRIAKGTYADLGHVVDVRNVIVLLILLIAGRCLERVDEEI